MKSKSRHGRTWILAVARELANRLKDQGDGTPLRIRKPVQATDTNTDGWYVIIGDLGKQKPRLEVWFDRFSGHPQRKLCACFHSELRPQITTITKRVARTLWPVRMVTPQDTEDEKYLVLTKRLTQAEFKTPVLEKYAGGRTYYGIYDPTDEYNEQATTNFCTRAAAFFEDVARSLPHATPDSEQRNIYPRYENRKHVASHIRRERSRLLAAECKIRDHYRCQACDFDFAQAYGKMGVGFAEAHHLVPLSRLRDNVRTHLEDLATVCANCHRMLHRMEGCRDDIKKLKTIVRKHC